MKSADNDKECVRRVLCGDPEAFSGVIERHAPRMFRLAVGIVRRRDVAEDVVQDALVKAYEKLGGWRGESSLSTWLYRIVYTTAISALRGGAVTMAGEFSAEMAAGYESENEDFDWEVTEENIALMRCALGLIAPLDRTLVNLFYLEECSVREVAAICGESEGNVKTRLHRARARLRKLMNYEGKR
jgi:RNA polymerase sigma-70 factor (ECF subfamily)